MNLCTSVFVYVGSIGLYKRIVNADTQSIRIANADGQQNKKEELSQVNLDFSSLLFCAERVGFKPTVRETRTPDFESGPFDHSGIFP